MTPDQHEYSLFAKDIVRRLVDYDFFIRAIAYNYNLIGARYECEAMMSTARLGEAYDYWQEDVTRTLRDGIGERTIELDHFKHAAFIAFWLRRTIPINEIRLTLHSKAGHGELDQARREIFLRYGNELCALLIGYQICVLYETEVFRSRLADIQISHLQPDFTRLDYIRSLKFPPELVRDFVMILKHKSMSPYGLYLMYKSLFRHPTPKGL